MNIQINIRNRFSKNNKEELDSKRFQDIKDQRYRDSLSNLHNELNMPESDGKMMEENALKAKKEMDMEKDTIFKKWN